MPTTTWGRGDTGWVRKSRTNSRQQTSASFLQSLLSSHLFFTRYPFIYPHLYFPLFLPLLSLSSITNHMIIMYRLVTLGWPLSKRFICQPLQCAKRLWCLDDCPHCMNYGTEAQRDQWSYSNLPVSEQQMPMLSYLTAPLCLFLFLSAVSPSLAWCTPCLSEEMQQLQVNSRIIRQLLSTNPVLERDLFLCVFG